ncbi:MAG: hypothetical protein MI974_07310 [Chitinophagales bacterium]|nr:hypothetical protein [Chitinophagales bacterium]
MNLRALQVFVFLIILFVSCKNERCDCLLDKKVLFENDSLIQELKSEHKESYVDYWSTYNEPNLLDKHVESIRYHRLKWTRDINEIYRITKSNSNYKLIYKDYSETSEGEDSLRVYKEIVVADSIMSEIKNLIELSCFWTLPISPIKKQFLDPVALTLEYANPELNACTNREYHLVDFLRHENEELKNMRIKLDEILVELCEKK